MLCFSCTCMYVQEVLSHVRQNTHLLLQSQQALPKERSQISVLIIKGHLTHSLMEKGMLLLHMKPGDYQIYKKIYSTRQ